MPRHRHRWTVDSIEEGVARVEVDGERMISVPAWLLPEDAAEGEGRRVTHARAGERSRLTVARDEGATGEALERSARQLDDMPAATDGGGDIEL